MKKILVLAACMMFLLAGLAGAATVNVGGSYSSWGGGSFTGAKLNGSSVPWMYCLAEGINIYANTTYNATLNQAGLYNGNPVTNATEIAWLLTNYATYIPAGDINTNNTDGAHALQGVLWKLAGSTTAYTPAAGNELNLYNTMLAAADGKTGDVSAFYWITPFNSNGEAVQPLITPTPIPAAVYLFGSGLAGLVGIGRFRRNRSTT